MDGTGPSVTLGKRVTLFAAVLTDVGPAIVNGEPQESVRQMADSEGHVHLVLRTVIEKAPETISRASFEWRP